MKVLAGGTFNILHPGHIFFLRKARELGDSLVVVVATDRKVKETKGRLIFHANDRRKMIESLKFVDRAVVGSDRDFFGVLEKEMPDIIAIGYDQEIDETRLSERLKKMGHKCSVVKINEKFMDYSTRKILDAIESIG